ncbi:MAG: DUF1501 domain-containing protein [Fuerstiella sp.]|nr:DUF1501 domain-containing protein [Fuerstiella sp.]
MPRTNAPGFGRAKSVIVVFASGGQSQIDTWDPKPNAPKEIRGAFNSIPTSVSGTRFCEHMPQIAKLADRLCVVRSMSHEDLDHGTAFYLSLTGRYHRRRSGNPLPTAEDHPCHGAVLQRVRPSTAFVQTAVHLNGPAEVPNIVGPGQFGGFLGKAYDPLTLGDVTAQEAAIPSLLPLNDVPPSRLESRQSLLTSIESSMTRLNCDITASNKSVLYRQAFKMLSKQQTRTAFDLSAEHDALRDRYGRNRSGQACLLARRLVEAGIPLVTVIWNHNNRGQDKSPTNTDTYGWDNHNDIFTGLKDHLLPRFDQSFSTLIEDLDDRGMLDETLVVCMGEFGRAPLVKLEPNFAGASPGRKHWPSVYSIVFAGAGVSRGTVVGASDEIGGFPASEHFGPWDTTATIFSALGIDPHHEYTDQVNRPYRISDGKVIDAIY